MRNKVLLALLLSFSYLSKSQIACFTTTDTIGCVPYTVNLTHCGDDTKPTLYDYGDGSLLTSSESHTYTTSGRYTISQFVSNNPTIDTFTIDSATRVVDSHIPTFTTNTCINKQLKITCDDVGYDKYIIDYGDGAPFDTITPNTDKLHTYPDSLLKTVKVTGTYNNANCGASSSHVIQPFNILIKPLTSEFTNINDTALVFNISGFNHLNYSYTIKNKSDNSIIHQDTFQIESTDTLIQINGLSPITHVLTVSNFDFCGNTIDEDSYTSISLSISAINGKNLLNWNNNQTLIKEYIIYKDNTPIDTVSSSENTYEDTDVLCGKEYCYQVIAVHTNNYNNTNSNISCVTSINNVTPPALDSTYSSFNNQNILEITWSNSAQINVSEYIIKDISNNQITETSYQGIPPFKTEHTLGHCYNVYYFDACGNKSNLNADTTCPIEMSVNKEEIGYTINYTSYKKQQNGTSHFEIEWLNTNFNKLKDINNGTSLIHYDEITTDLPQQYYYRVKAKPININEPTTNSNWVLIKQLHLMNFPTAFTPNHDGVNDYFSPQNNHIKEYEISIFDSWGKLMHTSTLINEGWNGEVNGEEQSPGAYQYQVRYTDTLGNEFIKSGTIKLIR